MKETSNNNNNKNSSDESINIYIEFLLFTVLLTTILSVIYMPFFGVTDPNGYRLRIFRIYIFTAVLFYILRKNKMPLEKMFRLIAIFILIVYLVYGIYKLILYIKRQDPRSRGGVLQIYLVFIGLILLIGMRKQIINEISYMIDFKN